VKRSGFVWLALGVTLLALGVVLLGAYVRLSDAGLGCPDWPGCYGSIQVPSSESAIEGANRAFPQRPVDIAKAWKEMLHRYFAGTLGLVILGLTLWAWYRRRIPGQLVAVPTLLSVLVLFQSLLGMWTVTLLVKPVVVTAHLLGGVAIVALAWWLTLRQGDFFHQTSPVANSRLRPWAWFGVILVLGQISLGGWTSSNYAALGCTEFPACYDGQWIPPVDFEQAFVLWRGLGVDYEYGVLDSAARTAIHLTHRLGALVVTIYIGMLGWKAARVAGTSPLRNLVFALILVLVLQLGLGIANVLGHLPLPVAVAHNGGAVLLLLVLLTLVHLLTPPGRLSAQKHAPFTEGSRKAL
jgi:cytochrome c oxidase assembly protein subunit 15